MMLPMTARHDGDNDTADDGWYDAGEVKNKNQYILYIRRQRVKIINEGISTGNNLVADKAEQIFIL